MCSLAEGNDRCNKVFMENSSPSRAYMAHKRDIFMTNFLAHLIIKWKKKNFCQFLCSLWPKKIKGQAKDARSNMEDGCLNCTFAQKKNTKQGFQIPFLKQLQPFWSKSVSYLRVKALVESYSNFAQGTSILVRPCKTQNGWQPCILMYFQHQSRSSPGCPTMSMSIQTRHYVAAGPLQQYSF